MGLPPNAGPRQSKVVQGGAERAGEGLPTLIEHKIIAGRTKVGRTVGSRVTKMTFKAIKERGSTRIIEAPELETGNLVTTHRPPLKGYIINGSKVLLGIYGNPHNGTEDSRAKYVRRTPHTKDDNRITAHRQDAPGMQPSEGQHAPQGLQDQVAGSLSTPNSAGALSQEPTSSPAQVCQRGEEHAPLKGGQ